MVLLLFKVWISLLLAMACLCLTVLLTMLLVSLLAEAWGYWRC